MTSLEFKSVPLFGGAIVADLPSTYQDVSEIRQVPDTQEVYLDAYGFTSIVFDILERVTVAPAPGGPPSADLAALHFHLSDIIDDDDAAAVTVHATGVAHLARMPDTPVFTLLATSPPGEKMRGRGNEPEVVAVLLVLVRLERVGTDLVVAINVPHVPGERGYVAGTVDVVGGRPGELIEEGMRIRDRVLGSLDVRDWGLFVDG